MAGKLEDEYDVRDLVRCVKCDMCVFLYICKWSLETANEEHESWNMLI
jgi:hypothetical protein